MNDGRITSPRRVLILANPKAGSGKSRRLVEELVSALQAHKLEPMVCWERERLTELATTTEPGQIRCVVAAGGDGTLLEVLNRAPGVPAAVLPLGNENLVARYCGITRSGRQVADLIAAGCLRQVDLARANGRLFALMASAGLDAEVVHRVHRRRRGHINHFTYALPLVQALQKYPFPVMDIEIEETGERLRGALVFVFNLPQYALNLPLAARARPDDGLLDLCVFERPGLWNLARYVLAIFRDRHERLPDFQHRLVRRVRLSQTQPTPLQTDGDPAGRLPAVIEVVPAAMTLVIPNPEGPLV